MARDVALVVLVDMDPPSEEGDASRGFYPARPGSAGPPDEGRMRARFAAVFDFVRLACGGCATLTVHTSPRFRDTLLRPPYPTLWHEAMALGCDLALHPHEDLADGSNLYHDAAHMRAVVGGTNALAQEAGLEFAAFRSGTFAFGPAMPRLLAEAGIGLDLSALPGGYDPFRHVHWPAASTARVLDGAAGLVEVPIGWNGRGMEIGRDYLFNEKMDLAGLCAVWDDLRRMDPPCGAVNFLCHGFGLVQPRWRAQAEGFLEYAAAHGGTLASACEARRRVIPDGDAA